ELVRAHERALPGGGDGLEEREALRTLDDAEPLPSGRHGARRDQEHLLAHGDQPRELRGDLFEALFLPDERAPPNLDHDAVRRLERASFGGGQGCASASSDARKRASTGSSASRGRSAATSRRASITRSSGARSS